MLGLFNRHQLFDKGFGPALGMRAADAAEAAFEAHGYELRVATSDWVIGPKEHALQLALLEGWLGAALEIAPESRLALTSWHERRRAHVLGRTIGACASATSTSSAGSDTRRVRRPPVTERALERVRCYEGTSGHDDGTPGIPRSRGAASRALFRSAYRLTGNRSDAEDVVQEVCMRAYTHLAALRTLEQPKSWLLKIAYRVFVDGVRRRARSPVRATAEDFDATRSSDEPSPEERAEAELAERRLLAALASLDREQRALLALQVEGYTLAELEAMTELSADVLKARLYRARVRLGKLLAADGKTPTLALVK